MSRAEETFQLDGRKDNVLLQIEKALLLTWSVSDLVTVPVGTTHSVGAWLASDGVLKIAIAGKPRSYRSGCVLLQVTYI